MADSPALTENSIVLITGGTSGIGLACAELFAANGAVTILVGRDEEKGLETVDRFQKRHWRCEFIKADLRLREQVRGMFEQISQRHGRLDVAINNAGIDGASFTQLADYPEDAWDEVIELNLSSVWLCMKHEIPMMLSRGSGAIVNVASLAGLKASLTGGCAYTASKHGLVGLTKSAAIEYATNGIRINAICPGLVKTPLAEQVLGESLKEAGNKNPMGRLCEPDEVARVVFWLSSEHSSFVNGVAIPLDGGIMAG